MESYFIFSLVLFILISLVYQICLGGLHLTTQSCWNNLNSGSVKKSTCFHIDCHGRSIYWLWSKRLFDLNLKSGRWTVRSIILYDTSFCTVSEALISEVFHSKDEPSKWPLDLVMVLIRRMLGADLRDFSVAERN